METMSDCRIVDYSGRRWCEAHGCWAQLCEFKAQLREQERRQGRVNIVRGEEWPVIPS